jgi:flagellar hook-associated protein 3 FlgL
MALSSFYPVVAGRTSDALSRYRSLYQVQVSKQGIQQLENQLSSGKRFDLPSQDPTAAIRVIGIQRDLEFRDQTLRNLDSSQGYLNVTESTLANVQDTLTEIRGLGVESAGNVNSEEERAGWVSQIDATIDRLAAAANTRYQDRYLFAGGRVDTPTVSNVKNAIQFTGNDSNLLTIADSGEYIAHNVTGQKALGLISDGVVSRVDLDPAAIASTRLADLNGGQGVAPGAIQLSDGNERVTIDLAGAETLGDVIERVNTAPPLSGRKVQFSVSNGALVAAYEDGAPGQLRILESGTGRTAADLGILVETPSTPLPIIGTPLDPILRPTTLLSQLNGGTGFNANDGIRIEQNGKSYNILIGTAVTLEDVTNTINGSGAAVRADITPDGRSLRIRSTQSGTNFSIGESTGNLAERLGLRTLHGQVRLDQLNFGQGINQADGPDLTFQRNDGSEFSIDLVGTTTVQDVLDRINNHVVNQDPATKINASLNSVGNGITISSLEYVPNPLGPPLTTTPGPIKIRNAGGSQAAWGLGLVPIGSTEAEATLVGATYSVEGKDPNPHEVKGVFNSLIRLREAITAQNTTGIARAVELLDQDLSRLSLSRGSLGVQQQRIDDLKSLQEDNQIELKADESRNFEADLVQTISELQSRQASYEASLKLLGNSSQLSLFNYI